MGRGPTAMHLGQDSRIIGSLPHPNPRVHPASSPLSSSHPSTSYHTSHQPFSTPSGGLIGPNAAVTGIDAAAAAAGARPAVMVSDPLGGTRMLNPNSPGTNLANPLSTRIQVGLFNNFLSCTFLLFYFFSKLFSKRVLHGEAFTFIVIL